MRVVHIYGGNLYGGVERLLVSLAEFAAAAPELRQTFALCYPGRLARELAGQGAAIHWLGGVRASRPWQVAAARRRLRRWLGENAVDRAVCHSWWPYAIFAPALRDRGVPVALWAHDTVGGQRWLERWAGRRRPELLLACSRHVAASLEGLYPGQPAALVAPPVPVPPPPAAEARAALRQSLDTAAEAVVILQASRLEPWKGHRLLLEALATIVDRRPWVAWIAGGAQRPQERAYLDALKAQAKRLGLENRLRWLGERDDVAALMGAANIFCQPNLAPEPFGIVLVEALAAGLPVVAAASGGGLEIVTAACGRLAAPEVGAVAAALRELLDQPELRRRLAGAAPARARALCDPATQMRCLQAVLAGAHPLAAEAAS